MKPSTHSLNPSGTRIRPAIATATCALLALSAACSQSSGDVAPESEAATSASAISDTSPVPSLPAADAHRVALLDGSLCEFPAEITPGETPIRCLLELESPLTTEDGRETKGLIFQDGMFQPDPLFADPAAVKDFVAANESAEKMPNPQSEVSHNGITIRAETFDEFSFEGKGSATGQEGFGTFFMAGGLVSPFWDPAPAWVQVPTVDEYVDNIQRTQP